MNPFIRKSALLQLAKLAGLVSDIVEKSLSSLPKEPISFKSIGSIGPGTTVLAPTSNPIKPDGSVDIIIQIRGLAGGDIKTASSIGSNAVIVTAEAGGKASKENFNAYGNPSFVNNVVEKILSSLKKYNPDVHLGKLTISSFSGGGSATANLLINKSQLPQGMEPPRFVFIDGLHTDPNSEAFRAITAFANEVKDNPSAGQLDIVHTAVKPGSYASTTEVANSLLNQTGVQRKSVDSWNGQGKAPVSQAQQGGLRVIQLYDKQDPYMLKDPKTGKLKPNIPGTAGHQHITSLNWAMKNLIGN